MHHELGMSDVPSLTAVAERFDSLAETAELMDDADGARAWRERAAEVRMQAMSLLDD